MSRAVGGWGARLEVCVRAWGLGGGWGYGGARVWVRLGQAGRGNFTRISMGLAWLVGWAETKNTWA